jgi:hypothetical protein
MNADGSSSSAKAEDDFDPFPAPKAAAVAPTTRKAPVDDAEMFE